MRSIIGEKFVILKVNRFEILFSLQEFLFLFRKYFVVLVDELVLHAYLTRIVLILDIEHELAITDPASMPSQLLG